MSNNQLILCSHILKEYYGEVVKTIAVQLMQHGISNMRALCKSTGLRVKQVKEALVVLLLQNIASFEASDKVGGVVEYRASVESVLKRTRFEKYIHCTKKLYGEISEYIIEELLLHGQIPATKLTEAVVLKLSQNLGDGQPSYTANNVQEKLDGLKQSGFICRCSETSTVSLENADSNSSAIPSQPSSKRKRASLDDSPVNSPAVKRFRADDATAVNTGTVPSDGIMWRVNFENIENRLRDQIIVDAVASRLGQHASEITAVILRKSQARAAPDSSASIRVSANEILDEVAGGSKLKRDSYSQWLKILATDARSFVVREEGQGGGQYYINFRTSFTELALALVESLITERFGLRGRRLFHLVYVKKQIEQKQVEILSMIRPKDAKELLYRMLEENYLLLTEVPKGTEYVTGKIIYLFSVSLPQVVRMLLDRCYRSLANLLCRRNHHHNENSQLLQQKAMLDAYIARLEAQGEDESVISMVKEQITPAERRQLENLDNMTYKLDQAFVQTDDSLFTLQTYMKYENML